MLAGQLIFVIIILGLWEGLHLFGRVDPFLLPPIPSVASFLVQFLSDRAFLSDLGVTALEIGTAFVIAPPLAIGTGLLIGERTQLAKSVNPIIYLVIAIPQSVFLPLFILSFGIGFLEKVIFGVTHPYFVVAINTFAAVRSVPASYVVAARSFGATRMKSYFHIYLRARSFANIAAQDATCLANSSFGILFDCLFRIVFCLLQRVIGIVTPTVLIV